MGVVRVETIINQNKKFSMWIESEGLYSINCTAGWNVEFLDKVLDICITDEFMLVRTEDRDFRNGCQSAPWVKDNREENNINVYDWQGNHLWNIGEVVGDVKMAFDAITHITPEEAEKNLGIQLEPNAHHVFSCIAAGFMFVIDVKNKKMLYKIAGKVR